MDTPIKKKKNTHYISQKMSQSVWADVTKHQIVGGLLPTVLEAGTPSSRCWPTRCCPCPQVAERMRELSGASFTAVLKPFTQVPPSRTSHLPIPSHWRLGFQLMNSGGIEKFRLKQ